MQYGVLCYAMLCYAVVGLERSSGRSPGNPGIRTQDLLLAKQAGVLSGPQQLSRQRLCVLVDACLEGHSEG